MSAPMRLVVLVSGNGSNLQAILDACESGILAAEVVAVVSNKHSVKALERAESAGVPAVVVSAVAGETRDEYDTRLTSVVSSFMPDFVVLAGYMRILSMEFLSWFPGQVINLHPSLPGDIVGVGAIEKAYAEFQSGIRDHSGVMVHFVPDEGVDNGPVLASARVEIAHDDTLVTFEEKMHRLEHKLLIEVLRELSVKYTKVGEPS
jgi:phosphoribosylglycinamide formyltransferase 1